MNDNPAIIRRHPPAALLKVVNPVALGLAARGVFAEQLLALHLSGKRTGHHLDIPVAYLGVEGRPTVFTNSGWRHNFRNGLSLEVTLRGQRRPAHATLVDDPARAVPVYHRLISHFGWRAAQRRFGIRITVRRIPTPAELRDAVITVGLSLIPIEIE